MLVDLIMCFYFCLVFEQFHEDNSAGWHFGEVQYFFQLKVNGRKETVALVSVFTAPDPRLLEESSNTLMVCKYLGNAALKVIPVKKIAICIAMVPFNEPADDYFFVCEKVGLEMAQMAGAQEELGDE